jgi:transcriptional regulator with XRE-family HTH domain
MLTTTQILQALLGAGLTQIEIARQTGIPQPRISRWAAGETPESADDALRLAQLHAERLVRPTAAQEAA